MFFSKHNPTNNSFCTQKFDRLDEVIAPLWRKRGTLDDGGKFAMEGSDHFGANGGFSKIPKNK